MSDSPRSLPQMSTDVDSALALVCTVPAIGRNGRRTDVQAVLSLASSCRGVDDGVAITFPNTDDVLQSVVDLVAAERNCCAQFRYTIDFPPEHQPIELRVQAPAQLVQPLRDLYVGLAREAGIDAAP